VRREPAGHVVHDLLLGDLRARRADDERLGQLLAAGLVAHADDGGVGDLRVADEHGLELGRGHLVALVLDQLLDAVDHGVAAVLVDDRDVAGVQPALVVEGVGGGGRVVQVALHHLRAAHPQLAALARGGVLTGARVDQPALRARQRQADRALGHLGEAFG
jgi:hypothetical protein